MGKNAWWIFAKKSMVEYKYWMNDLTRYPPA
jgi:hypothetical protein